jgi:hypothetical protein
MAMGRGPTQLSNQKTHRTSNPLASSDLMAAIVARYVGGIGREVFSMAFSNSSVDNHE